MHGEYKVHGGKLVVVDLDVRDGRLSDVQVAGDFFLEPDEALQDICNALEGLSVDASSEQIADAVRAGLRPDAMMLGFSPEAVAIAVRRALGVARTWRDFEWQIVEMPAVSPAMHLALDEVLAQEVAAGVARLHSASGNGSAPPSSSARSSRCATKSIWKRHANSASRPSAA